MVKIKVKDVVKIFGDNYKKAKEMFDRGISKDEILKKTGNTVGVGGVSFEVYEAETLVIMGLSGSGKSTLLRLINRLIEPTSGKIFVDGEEITGMSQKDLLNLRRKKFGMVFQRFAIFPHRSVIQNVEYGLEIQGIVANERREKSQSALELVGLKEWKNSYPHQLSGGMQQRVGLARALAIDPDILLMDEAFSALDPLIRREMQDELIDLQSRMKKTIIFITHDLDEAIKLGDRIILMKDGMVVQEGTSEEILTNPSDQYVEKFIEHVDMSKVLTAQGIMKNPEMVAFLKDGPRTVLRKIQEAGISSIFVVDGQHKIQGIIEAEDAALMIKKGNKDIRQIINSDIKTVLPDMPLNNLFSMMMETKNPVAVVNEEKRLLGVIVKGSIIAGLAKRGNENADT
ncbi:glycine betaine/L-proline ABC transporter ATP-binding protein [Herbivorax sp. ANBcel31]|uniref:quaternary amine ABC transporter ATP-binding protein n=1 Tax=Herbivorax sp. ANBcel31 TaxID=3069754 RepID=UPI0027B59807|nr:glycine betaine/L-proline ABC transporter ATP-binding protein [Herbivorax sp. ANBcel31]MDQ2087574.1 glycine betaine/L-proline ABC transporter ATP-binding protein [Herbivorax sp. ANBcel31]